MIASALSLLLMGGAVGIFIGSKQAYRTEDAMSRNQEAGRFALTTLAMQIREAGYSGCAILEDITPNIIAEPAPTEGFASASSILGYDGNNGAASNSGDTWATPANWLPNTDVLIISNGGECGADLIGNMGTVSANIQLSSANGCGFQAGDALLITDCQTADLFRATSVSDSGSNTTITHANSTNSTDSLSRAYQENATVLKFVQNTYFIGTSPNGNPALYRTDIDGNTEELVDNIADMQIEYGVDDGDDGVVDAFRAASNISDWSSVLSVQLSLLIRSDNNALTEAQTVTFNGTAINSGADIDRRLRSIFNSVVSIRNRLP
ncbi:MAG: PilW family protein [Chromatiales bacterium]|jgi:type IV pilus assembly protein PilW